MENVENNNGAPEDTVKVYGGMTARGLIDTCAKNSVLSANMACYQVVKAAQDYVEQVACIVGEENRSDDREIADGVYELGNTDNVKRAFLSLKLYHELVDYARGRFDESVPIDSALKELGEDEVGFGSALYSFFEEENTFLWQQMKKQIALLHQSDQLSSVLDELEMPEQLRVMIAEVAKGPEWLRGDDLSADDDGDDFDYSPF